MAVLKHSKMLIKKEKYDEDLDEDTDVNLVSKYGGVYKRSTR